MSRLAENIYFRSPTWLQNLLISTYGYNLYRKRYKGIFTDIMAEIRLTEDLNAKQIEALQAERLNQMIEYCKKKYPLLSEIAGRPFALQSGLYSDLSHQKTTNPKEVDR